ncbi:hypothetical protein ACMZ4Y_02575 [Prevotella histicola]
MSTIRMDTIGGATVSVISRQDSIVAQVMTDSIGGYIFGFFR